MPSIILDVISVIDAETSCAENSGDERQRFCFIVKETEKVSRNPRSPTLYCFMNCEIILIPAISEGQQHWAYCLCFFECN
jgi:hypothetical protein